MTGPTSFGEKTAWWAFKTTNADSIVKFLMGSGLELEDVRETTWQDGVERSYDTSDPDYGSVLITPPIDGYVLATSRYWLGWWSDLEVTSRASEWVDRLGIEVQYFSSERISGLYGWGKVTEDFEERAFVHRGWDVLYNAGPISDDERRVIDAVARDCVSFGFLDAAQFADHIEQASAQLRASVGSDPDPELLVHHVEFSRRRSRRLPH